MATILHDILKAYENRVRFFEEEMKNVKDLIDNKKYTNDVLINYLLKVLEMFKI